MSKAKYATIEQYEEVLARAQELKEELTETRLTYYEVVEQRNHLYVEGAKLSRDVDNLIQERGSLNLKNDELEKQLEKYQKALEKCKEQRNLLIKQAGGFDCIAENEELAAILGGNDE